MAVSVTLNTPLAEELSNVVHPKLAEIGWTSGGLDDSVLLEYIILMLVNGKTQEQIAAELSTDLLSLEPGDSSAVEFSRWLFEQVNILSGQLNSTRIPQSAANMQLPQAQAIQSYTGEEANLPRGGSGESGSAGSPDTEMGEPTDITQDGSIPTGPKSMRVAGRHNSKRLIGQISKAMDRTNDGVLHRVRPQQGTERINMHNRQPPKGPRSEQSRNQRMPPNARPMAAINRGPLNGGPGPAMMQMTPQQQMQLFAMYEQQARMMSEILSPQQQQAFMPGMNAPAINPAFRSAGPIHPQQPGRSLFERVEKKPQGPTGSFNRHLQPNGATFQSRSDQDTEMANNDVSSSMEVESSQATHTELSPDTICKYNLKCTKPDCIFAHQSPAAPPGTTIDVNDHCPFGAACKNRKCVARHPSPAQKSSHQSEQDCRFFPHCTNAKCPFRHPTAPMCRNGADCTKPGCKYTHVKTMCKFNPCLNPVCPYKHEEGQKRGAFNDKVWKAEGSQEREHVSERKFVVGDDGGEEELIVPGTQGMGGSQSSLGAEVVT